MSATAERNGQTAAGDDSAAKPLAVCAKHLAELRASGHTDETILANRFRCETDKGAVARSLGWRGVRHELGDCLTIPFPDHTGAVNGFCRLKPSNPRKNKKTGKPVRYEQPKGKPLRLFFPAKTIAVLGDPSVPLVLVEGEKKAATSDQEGQPAVAVTGVNCGQKKGERGADGKVKHPRELIDDFNNVALDGRTIYVTFDSDAATNANVLWAEWDLAGALGLRGARVLVVRLPPGPAGPDGQPTKQGLDDFIVHHGMDDFRRLMRLATEPVEPKEIRPNEGAVDPHRLARLHLRDHITDDGRGLHFHREQWWVWTGRVYQMLGEKELRARVTRTVKAEFDRINVEALRAFVPTEKEPDPPKAIMVTREVTGNTMQALAGLCVIGGDIDRPAWLTAEDCGDE